MYKVWNQQHFWHKKGFLKFFSQNFSPCSLDGTLCMFCETICLILATLLTQKNNFLNNEDRVCKLWVMTPHFGHKKLFFSKLYVRNSEKFSTFTQWYTMHLLPKGLRNSTIDFWETAHLAIFPTKLFHIPIGLKNK